MNTVNINKPITQEPANQAQKALAQPSHEEKNQLERRVQLSVLTFMGIGYLGPIIAKTLAHYQICLNTLLPKQALDLIDANVQFVVKLAILPILPIFESVPKVTDATVSIVTMPIVEELEFRLLIQELLLRRIPKMILNKVAPSYTPFIEAKAVRIARVALSTLIFAIAHTARSADHTNPCLGSNYGFTVLGLGAFLGMATEIRGPKVGLGLSIITHIFMNALAYVAGNMSLD